MTGVLFLCVLVRNILYQCCIQSIKGQFEWNMNIFVNVCIHHKPAAHFVVTPKQCFVIVCYYETVSKLSHSRWVIGNDADVVVLFLILRSF